MALELNLTAASSDLPAFFANYSNPSNFTYNGNGWFNDSWTGVDQFVAGIDTGGTPNGKSSVIMNGSNYSYSPGAFSGDVDTLELGSNLDYDYVNDVWVQDEGLLIDFTNATQTTAFSQAIYTLSHGGQLGGATVFGQPFAGLYDYFAEQGTVQNGTSGADVLMSFAGNDVMDGGGASSGFDKFQWQYDPEFYADGWGDDEIIDFVDGSDKIVFADFGWSDYTDFTNDGGSLSGNVITFFDGTNTSTITVAFSGSGTLDQTDFLFV
jgi:hypothetical protein